MSFSRTQMIATLLAGVGLLGSGRAHATTITTSSTTTWKSSAYITGAYSVLNFYPILQSSYNTAAGLSLTPSGSSTAFNFTGLDNGSYYLAGDTTQKTLASSADSGSYINIAFPTGENAFLLGTTASVSHPMTLTLSDGESFSFSSAVIGLSVSHPISWLDLSSSAGTQAVISDFWFGTSSLPQDLSSGGTPAPTPEPATVVMTGAGAFLLLFGCRRGKPQTSQAS